MKVITAPEPLKDVSQGIFLAGSIEQGRAVRWQDEVIFHLKDLDATILNPRRTNWDASWKQDKDNKVFREQVEWELAALEASAWVLMYFDPKTKAPVSLLEFGLLVHTGKLLVCCPEGYWRKGNIDIVCEHYNIPQADDLLSLVALLKSKI